MCNCAKLAEAVERAWPCGICLQEEVRFKPHDGTCRVNGTSWSALRVFLASLPASPAQPGDEKPSGCVICGQPAIGVGLYATACRSCLAKATDASHDAQVRAAAFREAAEDVKCLVSLLPGDGSCGGEDKGQPCQCCIAAARLEGKARAAEGEPEKQKEGA